MEQGLFLPGYGAHARSYEPGLPEGWTALQPPRAALATGSLEELRNWVLEELRARAGRVALAGHSMGGALAVLAAAAVPERVSRLVLVAPAGFPVGKSARACAYDFVRSVRAGRYRLDDVLPPLADFVRHPRAATRLARALQRLDLSREMEEVRRAGIPATVIACSSDTLTTPESARRAARLLGARYRELDLRGGHVWMFGSWHLLSGELARA